MAATRKYPDELRERATRMAIEARKDPGTRAGALRRIAEQLGVHPKRCAPGSSAPRPMRACAREPRLTTRRASPNWSGRTAS